MYKYQKTWREIAMFLPENYRIAGDSCPSELYIEWKGNKIHIDHYPNPESDAKIILLHGVGGNGRLLSFVGEPLFKQGYEVISPDLPGYGYSEVDKTKVSYHDWVELTSHLVDIEIAKDERPVFLFGLSAGGMLAYHAASLNQKVKGIIATNLLDQRDQTVRDYSAGNLLISRIGIFAIRMLSKINKQMMLPMKTLANMKAIVNNKRMRKLLIKDKTASGSKVPVNFVTTLIGYNPKIEPENFNIPVLLVHPEKDEWTPVHVSMIFYERLKGEKELFILQNAGHFPIESPGVNQLEEQVIKFIEKHKDN
jgi:alpha-beta hydrolase superfamily lysophospholipase